MERLVSLTIRVHDSTSVLNDSLSLQSKLAKAEKALADERKIVMQLQRRLSVGLSSQTESNTAFDEVSSLSAELLAAKSTLLGQQVELDRLRRRISESEGEISNLKEKLKRQESYHSEGRENRASEVKVRAAEDRAQVAEIMYRDLHHQYDSAATMVERLIQDNTSLAANCNSQGQRIKTLMVESKKKEATIKALENLMSRGSHSPTLLPDIQEAVNQAIQSLPGLDTLVADLTEVEMTKQGHQPRAARGHHRRCSSSMIEGMSAEEWKVQALQEEVQAMRQMLEGELRARGRDVSCSDGTMVERVDGDSQVKVLAQTLSMLEGKLEETRLLPVPPPSPPLQDESSSSPDVQSIIESQPSSERGSDKLQLDPKDKKSVGLWGWLMAFDVED